MRRSTKNAIAAVVAIVLALAIVIACGVGSSWFTNSDIATWFNSWGKGEQTEIPDDEQPVDEGGMQIGESVGNGISLMSAKIAAADYEEYGISPLAESAQQLTATITPANATNKEVDWSVAWVNASSAWANGKTVTDYVTVTPTSDGALTANVECKQAFGEQVVVTVTSRQNTEASATATVDYAKRVISVNQMASDSILYSLTSSGASYKISSNSTDLLASGDTMGFTPQYSVGTVDDEFAFSYKVSFSDDFLSALSSNGFSPVSSGEKIALVSGNIANSFAGRLAGSAAVDDDSMTMIAVDSQLGTMGIYNRFASACSSLNGKTMFTFEVTAVGAYSTFTGTCNFSSNLSIYDVLVQSVGINGSTNIIL